VNLVKLAKIAISPVMGKGLAEFEVAFTNPSFLNGYAKVEGNPRLPDISVIQFLFQALLSAKSYWSVGCTTPDERFDGLTSAFGHHWTPIEVSAWFCLELGELESDGE
jgi:hypothetical protein